MPRGSCWGNWPGDCSHWKADRHGCTKPGGHKGQHVCPCGHRLTDRPTQRLHGVGKNH